MLVVSIYRASSTTDYLVDLEEYPQNIKFDFCDYSIIVEDLNIDLLEQIDISTQYLIAVNELGYISNINKIARP